MSFVGFSFLINTTLAILSREPIDSTTSRLHHILACTCGRRGEPDASIEWIRWWSRNRVKWMWNHTGRSKERPRSIQECSESAEKYPSSPRREEDFPILFRSIGDNWHEWYVRAYPTLNIYLEQRAHQPSADHYHSWSKSRAGPREGWWMSGQYQGVSDGRRESTMEGCRYQIPRPYNPSRDRILLDRRWCPSFACSLERNQRDFSYRNISHQSKGSTWFPPEEFR